MLNREQQFNVTLQEPIFEVEQEFEEIVAEMNRTPIHISKEIYEDVLGQFDGEVTEMVKALREETGMSTFRPTASADCEKFFRGQGWNPSRLTATGKVSVSAEVLESLESDFPIATKILDARGKSAILSQLKKWKEFADVGTAQPVWHQFGTPMGRMSCEVVALQNRVMEVRKTVVPAPGHVFLSCDVHQMEYVGWASVSNDPLLKGVVEAGEDVHQAMGDFLRNYLPSDFTTEQRRKAGKTINFALLYWMSPPTLAGMLGVSIDTAKSIMQDYEAAAPTAIAYRDEVIEAVRRAEVVTTLMGRERFVPEINSSDEKVRRDAEKTCWHHHNSGSCADLMKFRMVLLNKLLTEKGLRESVKWVINMHDEFILEVEDGRQAAVTELIHQAMEAEVPGYLPMSFAVVEGTNWAELDS